MADVKHLLAQLAEEYDRMQAHDDEHHAVDTSRDPAGPAPIAGFVEQGDNADGGSDG